jgi:hypothetical protein
MSIAFTHPLRARRLPMSLARPRLEFALAGSSGRGIAVGFANFRWECNDQLATHGSPGRRTRCDGEGNEAASSRVAG